MNKIILKGNIVRDIELREAGNTSVASLIVAVQRKFKNANNEYESDFISCKAFGKTAEFISNYFSKGNPILLEGRIQTGSYDKADGTKVYTTDVIINEVEFIGNKKELAEESYEETNDSDTYEEFGEQVSIDDNFLD